MAKLAGIAVEVFRSGKFKGMGTPGTALTDDQKALIQAEVDLLAKTFKSAVVASRPQVTEDIMQGQSFLGMVAAQNRLVDALAVEDALPSLTLTVKLRLVSCGYSAAVKVTLEPSTVAFKP